MEERVIINLTQQQAVELHSIVSATIDSDRDSLQCGGPDDDLAHEFKIRVKYAEKLRVKIAQSLGWIPVKETKQHVRPRGFRAKKSGGAK